MLSVNEGAFAKRFFGVSATTIFSWVETVVLSFLVLVALFPSPNRFLAFFALPVIWLWRWRSTRHFIPRTPLDVPMLGLSLMVLVSLYATYDIAVSLPSIAQIVLGIILFQSVVMWAQTRRGWWFVTVSFGIAEFTVATVGLLGTRWINKVQALNSLTSAFSPRLLGIPGIDEGLHPNIVAGTLLWSLPLILLLSRFAILKGWLRQKYLKTLWALAILLISSVILGVFILTQSRSGYIAFAVTATGLLLLLLPTSRYRLVVGGLLVSAIAIGAVVAYSDRNALDRIVNSNAASDAALSLDTLDGRLEVWSRALYGIEDFPFTGMGMNTFRKIVHVLYPLFLTSPDRDIGHAHNEFLQAALDLGIPGLIAFISLYLISFWMLIQIWRADSGDDRELTQTLVLGLGGGLFAHLLFGLTDAVIFAAKPAILFWMLLGLIAALYKNSTEKKIPAH